MLDGKRWNVLELVKSRHQASTISFHIPYSYSGRKALSESLSSRRVEKDSNFGVGYHYLKVINMLIIFTLQKFFSKIFVANLIM